MHVLALSSSVAAIAIASAAQPGELLLRVPAATAPGCQTVAAAELPSVPRTDSRVRVHRAYDVIWRVGLGGGRRLRLLEDTVRHVAMVIDLVSPSLPSEVPPRVAMVALDSAGHVTGQVGRIPRDPAEISRRQEALAAGDTAAMRAATIGDFQPLSAVEAGRVAPLVRWLRQHCLLLRTPGGAAGRQAIPPLPSRDQWLVVKFWRRPS